MTAEKDDGHILGGPWLVEREYEVFQLRLRKTPRNLAWGHSDKSKTFHRYALCVGDYGVRRSGI